MIINKIIIIIITIIIKPFIDNKANYIIPLAPVLANLFMGHHENICMVGSIPGFRGIILS